MVEVFKTNVKCQEDASQLISQICFVYQDYEVNFDLDDCDKILRVCCSKEIIKPECIINIVKASGFIAEVLEELPILHRVHQNPA